MLQGKLNILMDGQFGSTGKGAYAAFIALQEHIDIALSNAGPNAGHTFDLNHGGPQVAYHLPISGILNDRSTIFLTAGSVIDPNILFEEVERFNIDPDRLCIDPRAAVIEQEDKDAERAKSSSAAKIASTQKGVGAALVRKIQRKSCLAAGHPLLKEFVNDLDISFYLQQGCTALLEVPQGLGLALNSGFSYPHCTSREITVASALADAQVHPKWLGDVYVCLRTLPIRVGHLVVDGEKIGDSGPFYPDSVEMTWDQLGLEKEVTTNTKRVRRVATFSEQQLRVAVELLSPDYVLLNFCNYLNPKQIGELIATIEQHTPVTHLGFGPTVKDIMVRDG